MGGEGTGGKAGEGKGKGGRREGEGTCSKVLGGDRRPWTASTARAKIEENKGDMKKLWRTFRGVLGDADLDVPDDHTADDFATFFQDKVDVVRASTATTPSHDVRWRDTKTLSNCYS